ncbi:3-keto-5-aminohexanoate cleavage protein [Lacibacter luteus]|uniref:3-keto-5-aminohexanoate cleavage protein n=1 Tax=Lacibacter luteus TaxID=2508719 RepID=A0A4Q1CDA4_9BACT|nr:3-keto-5-aminohexanoate cleavage protein [Lacibacter luteus]RXK57438.1 3-keto-5-aminohexanoate cleavage protein [Lacibacter luteus]
MPENTIINFCPTGMVPTTGDTPHVPVQVQQIIEEVHAAYELGITIAHLHARNSDETATSDPKVYQAIVEGVRRHCPDLLICLSTSGRNTKSFAARSAVIELQPDMCSLTLSSLNFINQASVNTPDTIVALADKMQAYGVNPELECFDMGMINYGKYLIEKEIIQGPFYWNLLFGNIAGMQAELTQMGNAIREIQTINNSQHFIALGALGARQLPVNAIAIASGYGVRVGLEDNTWYDRKRTIPASNMALLKRIHQLLALHERKVMPSRLLGEKGFYNHAVHTR